MFWLVVVVTCFTLGGLILDQSFTAWKESPITSNVVMKKLPPEYIPDLVICPPASNTKFGYDISTAEKHILTQDKRKIFYIYIISKGGGELFAYNNRVYVFAERN